MLAKNSARTPNLVQGGIVFFFLFVSCDGRSLGGAAGRGLRGSSFGSDLWCHVRLGGSRRLLAFGFLDSALASLRVSRHSPPLVHRGWLDAPRLLSCTGLFLFCVGLLAMSRSGPNLHLRIRFNPARGADKGGRFHKKPRHCPLSLSPTRRPPKTPLLHRNESSSAVRQRYGSLFVRA